MWSRLQASNWRLFLIRFLCAGLAVVATVAIVPGLGFVGWRWGEFTRIALIFGLLNATVKPLLQFLVLRFIFSTYGIVVVVINALLLLLLGAILDDTFEVYRPISLVVGGLVVGILGLIFETLLGCHAARSWIATTRRGTACGEQLGQHQREPAPAADLLRAGRLWGGVRGRQQLPRTSAAPHAALGLPVA